MEFTMHDTPSGVNKDKQIIKDIRYITDKQKLKIINLSSTTDLTTREIALMFNCTVGIICHVLYS